MPGFARTVAVVCAHHMTERGNNREDVFMVDDDRRVYLQLLTEQPTDEEVARIRLRTQTGRPLGGDAFLSKPEALPGRGVRPRPVGRPGTRRKGKN